MVNILETNKTSIIIAAAGEASRLQQSLSKQFIMLDGKPLLIHCIEKFSMLENIIEIVVITNEIPLTNKLLDDYLPKDLIKKIKIVLGGKLRKDSVYNGFLQLLLPTDLVLIHDVARPLFKLNDVKKCIKAAALTGAAVLAVPVVDTLKKGKFDKDVLLVEETINRENLYIIQTPQIIRYELLSGAYKMFTSLNNSQINFTDEAKLIELFGKPVNLVIGSKKNIKITYPEDLEIAEAIFNEEKNLKIERKVLTADRTNN